MSQHPFEIAVVCTGNQFRSPIVEGLVIGAVKDLPVHIRSCGTERLGQVKALPEAVAHAARFGVDLSAHRTRPMADEDLSQMDLILGFELMHVASAVVEAGAPYEKTFTILELCDLLERVNVALPGDPIARARAAVSEAHRLREAKASFTTDFQVRDPVGGSAEMFESTAMLLREKTAKLVEGLFGLGSTVRPEGGFSSRASH